MTAAPSARRHSHRSPLEWAIRIALALLFCWLGYIAASRSLAAALPDRAAEQAYRISSGDARIAAQWSRRLLNDRIAAMNDHTLHGVALDQALAPAEVIARQALHRDAMAVSAVATLGLTAQLRGNLDAARAWYGYAERLSRRDLPTQLWMIEDAVTRNDVSSALRHYDTALTTHWESWDLLFPVLANAAADRAVVPGLVRLLGQQPTWEPSFVTFIADKGTDPTATARLLMTLTRAGVPIDEGPRAAIINALLAAGDHEQAWGYYASTLRSADRSRSRDPNFGAMLQHPSELDWVVASSNTGLTASIQRNGHVGLLDFAAPPSVGGTLVHQIQLLPPGRYVLQGRSFGIAQSPDSRPYWILTCTRDAQELGRVEVPESARDNGLFSGTMVVPRGCPVQYLALIARASSALEGLSGQIIRAELQPAS